MSDVKNSWNMLTGRSKEASVRHGTKVRRPTLEEEEGPFMNASLWGGLPVAGLPSAGALRMILRFVWLYGNWASFE